MELAGRSVLDPEEREMLFRPRSASVSDVAWTVADVALLDEAKALLGPVKRRAEEAEGIRSYGHIVVDEAQDLTPMQLRMLARRSIGGSMTVVGDLAQATGPWAPSGWAEVVGHLPTGPGAGVPQGPGAGAPRGWRRVELTVNYRTPSEIVELAARVLKAAVPGTQPPEAVRVTGEPVRILRAGEDLCDRASEAAAEELQVVRTRDGGDGSVAVIAPASLVGPLAAALGRRGVEYGLVGGAALDAPVTLIAVEDSKGLEFDAVVVVEPARIVRESSGGLRSLYVALTRATRRAAVVHGEPLPSSLQPKLGAAS
jgi:DNA helicase IV